MVIHKTESWSTDGDPRNGWWSTKRMVIHETDGDDPQNGWWSSTKRMVMIHETERVVIDRWYSTKRSLMIQSKIVWPSGIEDVCWKSQTSWQWMFQLLRHSTRSPGLVITVFTLRYWNGRKPLRTVWCGLLLASTLAGHACHAVWSLTTSLPTNFSLQQTQPLIQQSTRLKRQDRGSRCDQQTVNRWWSTNWTTTYTTINQKCSRETEEAVVIDKQWTDGDPRNGWWSTKRSRDQQMVIHETDGYPRNWWWSTKLSLMIHQHQKWVTASRDRGNRCQMMVIHNNSATLFT
jgi:hypothetical protein